MPVSLEMDGMLSRMLHIYDLLVMSETIEVFKNKFRKWKAVF